MASRIIRNTCLLARYMLIFFLGILIGATFYGTKRNLYFIDSESPFIDANFSKGLKSMEEKMLQTFSFAYNKTHLWSMRLADDNYYHIARLLPCRTVHYVGGQKMEPMNFCDPSTINEFSVEKTLHAQKWLYEHQNPANCTNKKFAILNQFARSGFGSTVHQILWALGTAIGDDRIAVYQAPGDWLYGYCILKNPDCIFLPISNCSVPSTVDGKQTIRLQADIDHWYKPIYPPIFQNRSFNWYRSQLLFYLMRYNPETLAHVQNTIAQNFNPPLIDLHRPYIAVFVRRSDKVLTREMSEAYSLQQYFNVFENDARRAQIRTIYINSEDIKVFSEFDVVNKYKQEYYKLLRMNATKDVVYMALAVMAMEQRKKVILEFLTDLFIEANADLHVGTLTSNWCRLVDEMKLTLGKMIPFYTPENRYLVDV